MGIEYLEKVSFKIKNEGKGLSVKGGISGESNMLFHDDLKFKAITALLNSIDKKNFIETDNELKFD